MRIGERAKLTCSPDYAYGSRGIGDIYPFDSLLFKNYSPTPR